MNYIDLIEVENVSEIISYNKIVEQLENESYRYTANPERKLNKILKRNKKYTIAPMEKDRN